MNELEKRIRELTLRKPGDPLDHRVLSSIQSSVQVTARESDRAGHVAEVNAPTKNAPNRIQLGIISRTISGLVAALVIGMAIGNAMPSVWTHFGASLANRSSAKPVDGSVLSTHDVDFGFPDEDSEFANRHRMMPELSQQLREALQNRSTAGSQFVESVYLSAIAGASLWERQNREKFNVTTHVSDRRFDMCRDCHRVGG